MAVKHFVIDGQTQVSVYKRRGVRNIRLSVAANNKVRVTIPFWLTYQAGVKFAESKHSWILEQLHPAQELQDGHRIGKYHRLVFIAEGSTVRSRIVDTEIRIYHPKSVELGSPEVQHVIEVACNRALKVQAEKLLPPRLEKLANEHGFDYKSVKIKRMKSRWGSCDSHKNILLNMYLMQLPWEVIDYVLLHELTHTRLMKHGPEFWLAMEEVLPNTKAQRKAIKEHKPMLLALS